MTAPKQAWPLALGVVATLAVMGLVRRDVPAPELERRDEVVGYTGSQEPVSPLPREIRLDARKVALGERLFRETQLSADGTVACVTCHDIDSHGADGRRVSVGINGAEGRRNAPTVFNCAYNFRLFWDGRADDLEQQVDGPLHSPLEMGSSWEQVVARLRADSSYVEPFAESYGAVSADAVRDAIATFERSLITPDAPFDRYLRGEHDAISANAERGYALFKELGCVSCHQGVALGGNMFQRFGVLGPSDAVGSDDLGRYEVTGRDADRHVFKVPGLRNVALTAPYFHDGSVQTLDEAVRIMARAQLGQELPDDEVGAIVDFLTALTGTLPR